MGLENFHEYFDVVFEEKEKTSGYRALTYSKNNNNMGVIVSTATSGFANIELIPDFNTDDRILKIQVV